MGGEPVSGKLFVKGGLSVTGLVLISRPETGTVRCEHFITDHNSSLFVQTEFKLGVSNDDALAEGVICAFFVQGNGKITKFGGICFTLAGEVLLQIVNALLIGNILIVVADLCLGGGGIDGLRQLVRLF